MHPSLRPEGIYTRGRLIALPGIFTRNDKIDAGWQKRRRRKNWILYTETDGKSVTVILDIEKYRELLERLEGVEDLSMLKEMHKKLLHFREPDEFLRDYQSEQA